MRVFADTSALIAVSLATDRSHGAARPVWDRLTSTHTPPIVTNYVLLELHAMLQKRFGMTAVHEFANRIEPVLQVHWVGEDTHRAALAALLSANRRELSLVDCASFIVMRNLGLTRAFTLDPHFAEQGFEVIPEAPPST
ncbi:MAG: PIN domain-containing protein [Armatimonadetes bacterium]|nr:PIN domain-containing protein [Armatimonadota bacterium]